jgi:hypothetical protein
MRKKILLVLILWTTCVAGASTPWINTWTVSGPSWIPDYNAFAVVAFATDGDVVIAAPTKARWDTQITRVSPTGQLRWSVNLGGSTYFGSEGAGALLATADGATFAGVMAPSDGHVARIDDDGAIAWTARVPATRLIEGFGGQVIAAGCAGYDGERKTSVVSGLDRASGRAIWQVSRSSPDRNCGLDQLVAGPDGAAYSLLAAASTELLRIGADGRLTWTARVPAGGTLIGADANNVYCYAGKSVVALHSSDGATAWSATSALTISAGVLPADGDGPVVQFDDATLRRLASSDGSTAWSSVPIDGRLQFVANGALIATVPQVTAVNPTNGVVLWSKALPATDAQGNYLRLAATGPVGPATLISVLVVHTLGVPAPLLLPIDSTNGGFGSPIAAPAVSQGVDGYATVTEPGAIVDVGAAWGPDSALVRVRKLDRASGGTQWDSFVKVEEPQYYGPQFAPTQMGVASSDGEVAVTSAENTSDVFHGGVGRARVTAFGAGGYTLWSVVFSEPNQQYTLVSDPILMASGDVVVSIGTTIQTPWLNEPKYSVLRLAAANGDVIWRRDVIYPPYTYPAGSPLAIVRVGGDIVASGAFETGPEPTSLVRLAGSDGHTIWATAAPSAAGAFALFPQVDGTLIALGNDAWSRIDPNTGAALWISPATPDCASNELCNQYGDIAISNGDVYTLIENHATATVIRRRGDGSGIEDFWKLEPDNPQMRLVATALAEDADGKLWLHFSRLFRGDRAKVQVIAGFDAATGSVLGQQIIGSASEDVVDGAHSAYGWAAPSNGTLAAHAYSVLTPNPATWADMLLDTTVTAHGDLSASIDLDTVTVAPGDVLSFHYKADYVGDNALTGVSLLGFLPWSSGGDDVACSGSGISNCYVDSSSGNIRATFDIQPGGHLDISGKISVLAWPNPPPSSRVRVHGPASLQEIDTLNNFATVAITQSLFRNGFEQ